MFKNKIQMWIEKYKNKCFDYNTPIYNNAWPLIMLSKILFILPLKNVTSELNKVYYKLKSWEVVFCILVYPLLWASGLVIILNNFPIIFRQYVVYGIYHSLSNISFLFRCSTFIKLLKSIDQFDKHFYNFDGSYENNRRLKGYKYIWLIFALSYHFLVVFVYYFIFGNTQCGLVNCAMNFTSAYFFRIHRPSQIFLFVFFSYELSLRFHYLDTSCKIFLDKAFCGKQCANNLTLQLESYRLFHAELIYCTNIFNDVFEFKILILICVFFLEAVGALFIIILYTHINNVLRILYTIFSFILIWIAVAIADSLRLSVSISFIIIMYIMNRILDTSDSVIFTKWKSGRSSVG